MPSIYLTLWRKHTMLAIRRCLKIFGGSSILYITNASYKGDKYLSSGTLPYLLDGEITRFSRFLDISEIALDQA